MAELKIHVHVPQDRRLIGSLSLIEYDGMRLARSVLMQCDARGKASQAAASKHENPERDMRRPYGDTPTGKWTGCLVVTRAHIKPADDIGARWIYLGYEHAANGRTRTLLNPTRPDARWGLGIHAGKGDSVLRPTEGCVRLRDRDFSQLDKLIGGRRFEVVITTKH